MNYSVIEWPRIPAYLPNIPTDAFTEQVDDMVKTVNIRDREFVMTLQEKLDEKRLQGVAEGRAEGMIAGKAEGMRAAKNTIALKLLAKGTSVEDTAEMTELSIEEVKKLLETIKK